jgi:peptidyl-prolyl cis-trans isomerase SurA
MQSEAKRRSFERYKYINARLWCRQGAKQVALALFIVGSFSLARAETIEKITAIVNDEIIATSDLDQFANRLKIGGLLDPTIVPDEETKQLLLKNRDSLLQKLIDSRLLDGEVKRQGLSVTVEKVEQEIRGIAKKNNMSRDELKNALKNQGVSFSQYQEFLKTSLERQALVGKVVISKIKVSEDDVLTSMSSKSSDSAKSFEFTLAHIYFLSDKGGAAAAKARAEAVLTKLSAGSTPFEKLAAEFSEDPGLEQGGLLGVFKSGELARDLESSVTSLDEGKTTPVLTTRGGFHIVKLLKKKVIADPRLEKERDQVRARLYDKAFQKQLTAYVEQLRQDSFIRINSK